MNVKKIITLLLALVLAAGMVACGTKPAEDTDGNDGGEEAKALYERCPRLLKEKVKAILIKSGFEEITQ